MESTAKKRLHMYLNGNSEKKYQRNLTWVPELRGEGTRNGVPLIGFALGFAVFQ